MYKGSSPQFFRTTTVISLGPGAFVESRFIMTFLTILGATEILYSFRLVLEGKVGKEIPESSKLVFSNQESFQRKRFESSRNLLTKNFALSDTKDNTSRPLNRGGIADLPLLRTLIAICKKSKETSFQHAIDCFVLLAQTSLAASGTLFQQLPPCLNFTLYSEDLL